MNIFLDCGLYAGNALKKYINNGTIDDSWTVYGFDPNPDLDLEQMMETIPVKVNLIKKAVWVKDGETTFHISGRHDAAGIADLTGHTDPKEVTVETIDFSKFVAELPEANIICSMDIEGAEYQVLEKMIADKTINRISLLDIEFHHRFMNDYTEIESQKLINKLRYHKIKVKLKVALR